MRYLITILFMIFLFSPLAKGQEFKLHVENVMDKNEMVSTGLSKLTPIEKAAFDKWLNEFFVAAMVSAQKSNLGDVVSLQAENQLSKVKNFVIHVDLMCNDDSLKEMNRIGITKEQLQIMMEVALRKAGIEITDHFVKGETNVLVMEINMGLENTTGYISYCIVLYTVENCFVQRQGNLYSIVSKQSATNSLLGVIDKAGLGQHFRIGINTALDIFINNYLRANPKK